MPSCRHRLRDWNAVNVMASAYPKSNFTGYDIAEDAIARGRAEAAAMSSPSPQLGSKTCARESRIAQRARNDAIGVGV